MIQGYELNQPNSDKNQLLKLSSELAYTKKRLEETEKKLSILLDNMPGGVMSYDAKTGKLDFVSKGCLDIFHCSEEQLRDRYCDCFSLMVYKDDRMRVQEQIQDQLKFFDSVELTYRAEDYYYNLMWIYHRGRMVEKEDGSKKFYVVISDITEEKLVQSQLNAATLHLKAKSELDAMTGLFNKTSMEIAVEECIASSGVGACHAMLMIDTDNFKAVNDTFGHQYGDKIIVFVADTIKKIFRESDLVGRVGGDEFMVFMRHTTPTITEVRARQLNDAIRRTLQEDGHVVSISCSIGIAFLGKDGNTYKDIYAAADAALYSAKEGGKNQYRIS